MNYLSEKHKQLSESQQSGLMLWFGQLPMDKKAVAIGLSLTVPEFDIAETLKNQ